MNSIGTTTIETDRLILRRFTFDDANDMLKYWASKAEVQQMYSEPVYSTIEEVNGLIQKYIEGYKSNDYYRWAVIEKTGKSCIGQIAYFLVDTTNHFAEIEYCIGTEFQNKGYITEAARAIIRFGFEKIGLNKIQISTKSINAPSRRVIEKCGFTYEGTLREYFYFNGKYVDRLYYSMLRNEYFKAGANYD
ncbi:MAG: GNAT family N-acetyltransferase [Acutalibacteraceae bacterium]